ncbi:TetR/AcrR family transcriptional regulator [Fusibacter paucivorans]|uniref:TetR/AcrR family transcriptional regulator n=1 Tax=Fusibacter paucivorans TaxID=76009 RepID=A0ABS5PT42_9FIRM|nr:TetR/AcrR family transcriptional regulator [Fusibacter paucivorans]MBS7528087.1 TetR/AcrR family transcriptional regulator [Fusibacter paucivorans]
MRKKGLSSELIVDAAVALIKEKDSAIFSVRELALKLDVKAASLYNHIASVDDVNLKVAERVSDKINDLLVEATEGKNREDAIRAMAYAYYHYALENPQLYHFIIGLPALDQDNGIGKVGKQSIRVIRALIHRYRISHEEAVHFSRCFRGALHGFVMLETTGYFTCYGLSPESSFKFLIDGYTRWIQDLENHHMQSNDITERDMTTNET